MNLTPIRIFSRIMFLIFAFFLLVYIFLENYGSIHSTFYYSLADKNVISGFSPSNRFKQISTKEGLYTLQNDDLIYFSTKLNKDFDTAKIKIFYRNPYHDQDLYLGFQQGEGWNYSTKLVDSPLLNNLNWTTTSDENTVLYQRNKTYTTISQFLNNLPDSQVVGTYNYDPDLFINSTHLENYSPSSELTKINIPLRGKNIFYVYLKDEPLNLTVTKQDLNWNLGDDSLEISVYKNQKLLFQAAAPDDGVVDDLKISKSQQSVTINSPPSSYLEEGVYKIVLNASADVIINSIVTNLHKIVFKGPLYPVPNADTYPSIINTTHPTQIYTDSKELNFKTFHSLGLQVLTIGNQKINLNETGKEFKISGLSGITTVHFPNSDVIITSPSGYFSFTPDQYFRPHPIMLRTITNATDVDSVDFIISSYKPSDLVDGWHSSEITFDISGAFIKNRKLAWIIKSPQLKERGREIEIKNIELELKKTNTICSGNNKTKKVIAPLCYLINDQ